jgi:hypothetical protein
MAVKTKTPIKPQTKVRTFDGTVITITPESVTVVEGTVSLTIKPANCPNLGMSGNAAIWMDGMQRKKLCDKWTSERVVYCFGLAERWARQETLF